MDYLRQYANQSILWQLLRRVGRDFERRHNLDEHIQRRWLDLGACPGDWRQRVRSGRAAVGATEWAGSRPLRGGEHPGFYFRRWRRELEQHGRDFRGPEAPCCWRFASSTLALGRAR